MTKLKHLKGQPLLGPPTDREWWRVTGDDIEAVKEGLDFGRKTGNGHTIARIHYIMKTFWMPQPITKEDEGLMLNELESMRKDDDGRVIAWMHFCMKGIGMPQTITVGDRKSINSELSGRRADTAWYSQSGLNIARMLYFLKDLGVQEEVAPDGRGSMLRFIEMSREIKDGSDLAEIYHYMLGLGLKPDITDKDRRLMEKELGEFRANNSGLLVAEMLWWLSSIYPGNYQQETRGIPPLRDFRKK